MEKYTVFMEWKNQYCQNGYNFSFKCLLLCKGWTKGGTSPTVAARYLPLPLQILGASKHQLQWTSTCRGRVKLKSFPLTPSPKLYNLHHCHRLCILSNYLNGLLSGQRCSHAWNGSRVSSCGLCGSTHAQTAPRSGLLLSVWLLQT